MKYKVGDTVRVKDWEDMEQEYGTASDGAICLPDGWYFTITRKPFCGKDYKISEVFDESYSLEDAGECQFTDEMLLPVGTGKDKFMKIDLCEIFGVKPDQVFKIKGSNFSLEDEYRVHEKVLQFLLSVGSWEPSTRDINEFHDFEVVLCYATEEEKTILRSLDEKYLEKGKMYRLETGELRIVIKTEGYDFEDLFFPYSSLFQFIRQNNNEIPIRDIIGE